MNYERREDTVTLPILNIRVMTDDEWNKLAYQNWLQREGKKEGENADE